MARLQISDGSSSRTVELTDATTVAGRAPENKVVIDDKQASRRHFQIDRIEYGFKLVDLESRNGTRVNDRSVNQHLLRPGDKIQIGKHVLTFEDPNFREPPADVAARLGPTAPASAGRVEAPSAAPDTALDRGSNLPVAQEVVKPAVAVTPAPPADTDYRKQRNRSGHTTAVQKNLQYQIKEEQKTLTMVAVGAGVFIFVVILLIFLPSSPSADIPVPGKVVTKTNPGGLSDADLAEKEAHEFEELSNYCDRNRNVPASYNEIISRVDAFEKKYPRTLNQAKLKEYRSGAAVGLKTSRNAAFSEAERQAAEDLRKNDFAGGMKKIRDLLAQYKSDADIHERLVKLKEQAVDDAKMFFQTKQIEADAVKSSRKDEAREIYQSILKAMGAGSVPEFDDYCRYARLSMEGLQ
jgi:pSer/pThr/pTyr-binding forkhead associated (FHA) protein